MSSIDGLISGMKTTDMISQLMQVEALPQTAIKNKVAVQGRAVAAYQSINTRMSSLLAAAKALGSADTWGAMKATSSSDAAVATAKPGAAAGTMTFTVDNLAAAHTLTFDGWVGSLTDATTAAVMSSGTVSVRRTDGSTTAVTPADASLQSVVNAINATGNAAYKAAAVQVAPGRYTLQLTSVATGDAGVFASAPAEIDQLGNADITTLGANARITVGSTIDAYQVTSASNTFNDVLTGVTMTVTRTQTVPPVTVSLQPDAEAIATKVQALVDNANVALSEITAQTRTKTGDVAAGPLVGDSTARTLSQDIISAVSGGAGDDLGSLSAVGIALDRTGKVTFNRQTFLDSLAADPVKTRAYFDAYTDVAHLNASANTFEPGWDKANGLARRLEAITRIASEGVILPTDPADKPKEGVLSGLINRRTAAIRGLNEQVASWDVRLDLRRAALERQWSGLEVALSKLQSQSNWLSGQLAGLSTSSSA
jgi:flagellar hook-associated protein 2